MKSEKEREREEKRKERGSEGNYLHDEWMRNWARDTYNYKNQWLQLQNKFFLDLEDKSIGFTLKWITEFKSVFV